jgi:hypothetical protein
MTLYGDVYIVVGPPGTSLATISEKLARRLKGAWGGEDIALGRPWMVLDWAFNSVFRRRKPVVLYLPHLGDTDVRQIDTMLANNRRTLRRVIWLQVDEPHTEGTRQLWDQYRAETLPAIWSLVERGLVTRVTATGRSDEDFALVWQGLAGPPMQVPGPLFIFVGTPGAPTGSQARRLAARLDANIATLGTRHPMRWVALGAALGLKLAPADPIILVFSDIHTDDLRHLDAAVERAGRRITRVVWLLKEQEPGDSLAEWNHYRRTIYPAILLWRERRLVSDVHARLDGDAVEQLVWRALQREPSYP